MQILRYRNVIIRTIAGNASRAILMAHGGYTPPRNRIFLGSGCCQVPSYTALHFHALPDFVAVFTHGVHLLAGANIRPMETVLGGRGIVNYSLTYNEMATALMPNAQYDLITVAPHGKAHMVDVFAAMRQHQRQYTDLNSFACRVNKLTYDF